MWSSLPCFFTIAVLLLLHLVTFLVNAFYCLFMAFFNSTCMLELRFASTEQQKSLLTSSRLLGLALGIWTIDSSISYIGSIGWRITDPGIYSNTKSQAWMMHIHSFIHSFSHLYARDLCQSFQVPHRQQNSQYCLSIWTIDSGYSYTGRINLRITDPGTCLNTDSIFV